MKKPKNQHEHNERSSTLDAEPAADQGGSSRKDRDAPKTKRIVNLPLLLGTLVVGAVLGGVLYGWHSYQVTHAADDFLRRADALEKEEDWKSAAEYIQRYTRLVPDDVEARIRLARTFDKSAVDYQRKQRAVRLYYETIGIAGGKESAVDAKELATLRGRLVELLLELQRFSEAQEEGVTLQGNAHTPELQALAARSLAFARYGLFRNGIRMPVGPEENAVGTTFVRALPLNTGHQQFALQMALICRSEPEIGIYPAAEEVPVTKPAAAADGVPADGVSADGVSADGVSADGVPADSSSEDSSPADEEPPLPMPLDEAARAALADQTMDGMVDQNAADAQAYLLRYGYRRQYGLTGANEDLDKAMQLGPSDGAVCLAAAENALRKSISEADTVKSKKLRADAIAYYQRAIEATPGDVRPYLALGGIYLQDGQPDKAIEAWRQGLEKVDNRNLDLNLQLAETLIEQGQLDGIQDRLDIIQDHLVRRGGRMAPADRLVLRRRFDLLQGRWYVAGGDYVAAKPLLERVATLVEGITPEEQRQLFIATYLLGQCHAQLEQWEPAARRLDEANDLRPGVAQLHKAAAEAWEQAGQPSETARHLEQALLLEDSAPGWLDLARARLQEQVRVLPRESRDWGPFERALAEAQKPDRIASLDQPWQSGLLEVSYLMLRGDQENDRPASEKVRDVLNRIQQEYPDAAPMWASVALVWQRLNDTNGADSAYQRLAALEPQGGARYLVRSQLLAARGEFDAARREIIQGLDAVPATERDSLRMALVAISMREGKASEAASELALLQKSQPKNVAILTQLADLAFEQGDMAAVRKWEQQLRQIEGDAGFRWRYERARRLLVEAKTTKDVSFREAIDLAEELLAARPGWSPAVLLSALIYHRTGQVNEAISAYEKAIRLGERRLSVYERLLTLLFQAGRLDEAEAYFTQLAEYIPSTEKLSGLKILTAASRGESGEALTAARSRAKNAPDDMTAQLWLGQTLTAAGLFSEAEPELRKAVALAPDNMSPLSALLLLYLRANRPDDARRLLDEMAANEKLPAAQNLFVRAQIYEKLGDREPAKTCYLGAQEQAQELYNQPSGDRQSRALLVSVLTRLAAFLASDDLAEAEVVARQAVATDRQSDMARRVLVAVLSAEGSEDKWAEAQSLLAASSGDPEASVSDRRLKASLLVRRGGRENLDQARELLEELLRDPSGGDTDRLLLARLYEAQAAQLLSEARGLAVKQDREGAAGRRSEADAEYAKARQQYVELGERNNPQPEHLGAIAEFLLRRKEFGEAQRYVDSLVKLAPDDLGVARLRARVLQANGQVDAIQAMLEPVAKKQLAKLLDEPKNSPEATDQAEAQLALTVGGIYRAAELNEAAEPWLRIAVDKLPSAYAALAGCLAAQGRVDEAVELCIDAAKDDSSVKLPLVLASLMVLGTASEEDLNKVDPILADAVQAHPDDLNLLSTVASLRVVQGRLNDAVELYERILKTAPDNLLILNNLGTILAEEDGRADEALKHINKAIELSGPSPALLDSKGIALFQLGRFDEARRCLEAATWEADADPRFFFHLAATYLRLGDIEKTREAFQRAKDNKLEQQILTPSDQRLLVELKEKLAL